MLGMLIAYDADGNIVGRLNELVRRSEPGAVYLLDFEAHERAGGEVTDFWTCPEAIGAKVWPEWLGRETRAFRVDLEGPPGRKRIAALVHKVSGHRRERAAIEEAIADRIIVAHAEAIATGREPVADLRDVVGGPDKPLILDDEGRTVARTPRERPNLPLIGVTREERPPAPGRGG